MQEIEPPQKGGMKSFLYVALAAAVFACGVFVWGFGSGKVSPGGAAAAISSAFRETLGLQGGDQKTTEVDLNAATGGATGAGSPAEQRISVASANPSVNSGGSPAVSEAGASSENNSPAAAQPAPGPIKSDSAPASPAPSAASQQPPSDLEKRQAPKNSTVSKNQSGAPSSTTSPACLFQGGGSPRHAVLLNEIAWMGSPAVSGVSASQAGNNEWMELKNISGAAAVVSNWQIVNSSGKFKITLDKGEKISAGGFYLLERTDDNSVPGIAADKIYSGALANSGEWLRLFDGNCNLIDEVNASAGPDGSVGAGWPGGDNNTKQTMERNLADFGWHTSALPGGTPNRENSNPPSPPPSPPAPPSTPTSGSSSLPTAQTSTDVYYNVGVSMQGGGSGIISSDPAGIHCGLDCIEQFPGGSTAVFTATPDANSSFSGWSAGCFGATSTCGIAINSNISLVAVFVSNIPSSQAPASSPQPAAPPPASPGSPIAPAHLVIAAVQIAGASSTNDFIKIFNPTATQIDASGWKLRKRTNTGTEYSVRVFPSGSMVQSQAYFVWANSQSGFSASIGADTSSTETLAADNSIAFEDVSGAIVDQLAWGNGTNQFVEGVAFATNPAANQALARKFSGGVILDTDNNSADFELR